MLVCDACDKGYHTFCLQPAMDSLPSDPWKCRVSHNVIHLSLPWKLLFLRVDLNNQNMFLLTRTSLSLWFTFYPHYLCFVRGVVYALSVVSVDWHCQVRRSGSITTPFVKAASATAALCVEFAAKLPAHLLLCSAAACAAGQLNSLDLAIGCVCGLYGLTLFYLDDLFIVLGGCTVSVLHRWSFQKQSAFACFARRIINSLSLKHPQQRYKPEKHLRRLKDTWILWR